MISGADVDATVLEHGPQRTGHRKRAPKARSYGRGGGGGWHTPAAAAWSCRLSAFARSDSSDFFLKREEILSRLARRLSFQSLTASFGSEDDALSEGAAVLQCCGVVRDALEGGEVPTAPSGTPSLRPATVSLNGKCQLQRHL